ncbi:RING-type domain-containing protein [Mycena sanguinolenta]|uniref:RBR-type E3 ubiquitin transferase n=1 Tax=Mycena sanguinolenta TaxID=230812 RepID=A0A8H6Z416_9AGAR|nr:RING-type domain-containing protein [Mycena sanguinolenta]
MTKLEPESPIPTPQNEHIEDILSGQQKIVSHVGASQYQSGGIASCGLAGLNFVRVVLGRVERGFEGDSLLEDVLSRRTSEEVISICSRWASNAHLEVEDIFKAMPIFERSLKLASVSYSQPSFKRFRDVLSELQSLPSYAAVLITRPPEIITCLKLHINSQDVFIIFDSHPRTEHPNGAGLIVNTSLDATAQRLDDLLTVDSRLLADRSLQWQSQLLANFSGHFFVAKDGVKNSMEELTQAVLDSSLVALSLQAEILDLKFQNSSLSRERQSLETELADLKDKYRSAQRRVDESKSPCSQCSAKKSPSSSRRSKSNYHDSRPTAGPSRLGTFDASPSSHLNALEYFSSPANIVRSRRSLDSESMDLLIATQLQMSVDDANHAHWRTSSRVGPRSSYAQAVTSSSKDVPIDDHAVAAQLQMDWDREERDNALKAQAMQHEFEREDAQLVAQRAALQKQAQVLFDCGICFDRCPEDYVSRIPGCSHAFCRNCMQGYVVSKLRDKLYPIFCPMCATDQARVEPGMITDDLVQMLGLDDKEYQVLQELQIASMSILLHCRRCKESVFVDRAEYEAEQILVCPLPRCNYAWCKACQQSIPMDGPKHSCDGSSELEHLMKRRGWKHCPGCKTPFQKSDGCNHMTCMSPGCNTHFCYICGESIVRSALQREVRSAVSAHYRRCRLFEDVPER